MKIKLFVIALSLVLALSPAVTTSHTADHRLAVDLLTQATGDTITVAFEDIPVFEEPDWDYNDWVTQIHTEVTPSSNMGVSNHITGIMFTVEPQVKLAGYDHTMHFVPDTFGCDGTYELDVDGKLGVGPSATNGIYYDSVGLDVIVVPHTGNPPSFSRLTITFDAPCRFTFPPAPTGQYHGESLFFDPYLHVRNQAESDDIHRGDPRMLVAPGIWEWPDETQPIWAKYTKVQAGNPPAFVPQWWTPSPPTSLNPVDQPSRTNTRFFLPMLANH